MVWTCPFMRSSLSNSSNQMITGLLVGLPPSIPVFSFRTHGWSVRFPLTTCSLHSYINPHSVLTGNQGMKNYPCISLGKAGAVKDSTEDRQMRAALMGLGHPEPTSKGLDKPSLMSLNWDCVKTKRWQGVGFLT